MKVKFKYDEDEESFVTLNCLCKECNESIYLFINNFTDFKGSYYCRKCDLNYDFEWKFADSIIDCSDNGMCDKLIECQEINDGQIVVIDIFNKRVKK